MKKTVDLKVLLRCGQRTVDSYVKDEILPVPVDGVSTFFVEDVQNALNLGDGSIDELITESEAEALLVELECEHTLKYLEETRMLHRYSMKTGVKGVRPYYMRGEIMDLDSVVRLKVSDIPRKLTTKSKNAIFILKRFMENPTNADYMKKILGNSQYEVVCRIFLNDESFEDIAKDKGVTPSAINMLFNKACRRMSFAPNNSLAEMLNFDDTSLVDMRAENVALKALNLQQMQTINALLSGDESLITRTIRTLLSFDNDTVGESQKKLDTFLSKSIAKIDDMDFSVRTVNCLKSADIDTLADLLRHDRSDLQKHRNMGKKSLDEIEDYVKSKGMRLGMLKA